MIITKAKLKKIIKEELDKDQVEAFAPLVNMLWEVQGEPEYIEQIEEIAMSLGDLEDFYQFYRNSIFHMFFEKSETGYSAKREWDTGPDALYIPYVHPISKKQLEIDVPMDWEEDESILESINYIADEIMYQLPLTHVLVNNEQFMAKMGDEVLKALRRLHLV